MTATKYSGAEWIEAQHKPMSALGKKVADILGQVYLGIYHIQNDALRADWSSDDMIEMTLNGYGGLATFDYGRLTYFVVLCHDAGVRMQIEPCNPYYFRVKFWQRNSREGYISERMPTIEEHIKIIHECLSVEEIQL